MGSATRDALARVREAADAQAVRLEDAREVFDALAIVADQPPLASALGDTVATPAAKRQLVERVFASAGPVARDVIGTLAEQRLSHSADVLDGLELAAVRLAAHAAGDANVVDELLSFGRIVGEHPDLELALGSRLAGPKAKTAIVERLTSGKTSPATTLILSRTIALPRGRRIGQIVRAAADAVADAKGRQIATVTSAAPLPLDQLERLRSELVTRYGRDLQLQQIVDPSVIGGLRVAVADDVIDGTVRAKFNDLRLRLA